MRGLGGGGGGGEWERYDTNDLILYISSRKSFISPGIQYYPTQAVADEKTYISILSIG